MKKQLAIIVVCIAFLYTNGYANHHHEIGHPARMHHPGDTILPGSKEWVHAGSPHDTKTGEPVALIWDEDGNLVMNTPENSERIRLQAAVQQIERESPDRIIRRPVNKRIAVSAAKDTGYDPYKWVMHWTDSVATFYKDPDFLESVEEYYRRPTRLDYYPTIYP
ncbi:MAG: hypothetical protein ACHQNE_08010, partial [Candidatus Kapaibacterium sp.]